MEESWVVYGARHGRTRATVAMRWERRGDFSGLWGALARREDAPRRPSWRRVKKRRKGWYERLIDELVARPWIHVDAPAERAIRTVAEGDAVRLRIEDEDAAAFGVIGVDVRAVRR